ncbi:glycosyltransferase [Armatimonas sp.]|uniref:glycosyltransferase n=1 Tax=Armatimonas sp. TaxID=1872638 RepID=UPI00286D416E|nr:glycosyltransferase [Armatimonas sp.]
MRLLFISPYVPSPIRVRTYQILRHLALLGCEITLVALEDAPVSESARAELATWCKDIHLVPLPKPAATLRCLLALPTPTPIWVAYCQSPELKKRVTELVKTKQFDVAHVEHLRAAAIRPALGNLPCVLDAVDCITALQRQMFEQGESVKHKLIAWEEWSKLRAWEPRAYALYNQLAVTTTYDARELQTLDSRLSPEVIPNGVDLDYFQPRPDQAREKDTIIFSGKMSYRANEDAALGFASSLWPRLKEMRPNLRWLIVGSEPSPAVQRLAQDPAIEVTGYVPDIRPYLSRASVAICPLRIGVGIQNKALEAMAMACPVVASPIAGRALQNAEDDGGITIAKTEEEFLRACQKFLSDPSCAQATGASARRFVERHHRWDCAAKRFLELYTHAITSI